MQVPCRAVLERARAARPDLHLLLHVGRARRSARATASTSRSRSATSSTVGTSSSGSTTTAARCRLRCATRGPRSRAPAIRVGRRIRRRCIFGRDGRATPPRTRSFDCRTPVRRLEPDDRPAAAAGRARARRCRSSPRARRARPPRRGAPSSRRATGRDRPRPTVVAPAVERQVDAVSTPSRAASSPPSSASGPVSCSGPVEDRRARAPRPRPPRCRGDRSTRSARRRSATRGGHPAMHLALLGEHGREERRLQDGRPAARRRRAGARSRGGCRAARSRDPRSGCSRPSRCARRPRLPRRRSRWSRARPDPASATTPGTRSSPRRTRRASDAGSREVARTTSSTAGSTLGTAAGVRTRAPRRRAADRGRAATSRAELSGRTDHEHLHGRRVSRIPS